MGGARYHRTYEKTAMTPYARVLTHLAVSDEVKEQLPEEHEKLNPLTLKQELDTLLHKIFKFQTGSHGTERESQSR